MASCIRNCLFQSRLHAARKSIKYPLFEHGITYQSRHFLTSCTSFCQRKGLEDFQAKSQDKEMSFSDSKKTNVHQIDQKLFDALHQGNPIDREEYFKKAWQRKYDFMTQDKFRKNVSGKASSMMGEKTIGGEDGSAFGTLQALVDEDDGLSKNLDYRNPNERLRKAFPDDLDEDRDWRKNIPLTRYGRLGRKAFYYTKKMSRLGKQGKVKEAIQVFDEWMMLEDRVMPSKRTFITLIGIVGRAGFTSKAFQLFRQMKHLGLDPPDHVYTSLFNACANCPTPHYGLKRANSLYHQMKVKGVLPSPVTTMAAMKAFAMCGDFARAFQILDETGVALDTQCLNTLLLACAADQQSGFRTALKVWRTMRENKVRPSQNSYNLLIRCIRDCGAGDALTLAEDLGLKGQGQQLKEKIPPIDLFTTGDTALLLSGPDFGDEKDNSVTDRDSFNKNLPEINPMSVSDCSHSRLTVVSEELLGSFEKLSVPDGDGNTSNLLDEGIGEETVQERLSSACYDDGNSFLDKVIADDSSLERELWVDGEESQISVQPFGKDNQDPLGFFPHDEGLETGCKDLKTQLACIDDECKVGHSDLTQPFVSLEELKTKSGRLALIGGVRSVLTHMLLHGIQPDMQTLTQILACVPNDADNEALVLRMMEIVGVVPDVDFLNDVMMRRNMRHQSDSVKEVVVLMSKLRLTPNMRTYAAVALTCHKQRDALALLEDMEAANLEPSIEVMGHLIYISRLDFPYKRFLLRKVEELALCPTPRIIGMIEKSVAIARRNIAKAERKADESNSRYLSPHFQKQFSDFMKFYQAYLKRTELRQEKHPWERFSGSKTSDDKKLEKAEVSN